ncbi:Hypothetical predicted protein [Scomber scombrus]|uniref:Uncharacterized protein n=1 Tax=Scomber scombrus TaxID=13677 RepID=A0AAV1MS71_SCOSC
MKYKIHLKNAAFTFGGVAAVKAANYIIPSYETVILTTIVLLIILLGKCMLSAVDITKVVIGVITLSVRNILTMDTQFAIGFYAFVILAVLCMNKKQESVNKKKLRCPDKSVKQEVSEQNWLQAFRFTQMLYQKKDQ